MRLLEAVSKCILGIIFQLESIAKPVFNPYER